MKRHVQVEGVRKWAGDDLIELQNQPLKVLDSFMGRDGDCVVSGCTVTQNADGETFDVSSGIVCLTGTDHEQKQTTKAVPFEGVTGTILPIYLTLAYDTSERVYADGRSKPIAYSYKAVHTTVKPADRPYIEITENGAARFIDTTSITTEIEKTNQKVDTIAEDVDELVTDVSNLNQRAESFIGENRMLANSWGEPIWPDYKIKDEDIGGRLCFSISVQNTSQQPMYINIYNETVEGVGGGTHGIIDYYIDDIAPSDSFVTLSVVIDVPEKVRNEGRNLYVFMSQDHLTEWTKIEKGEIPTPYIPPGRHILTPPPTALNRYFLTQRFVPDPETGEFKQVYCRTVRQKVPMNGSTLLFAGNYDIQGYSGTLFIPNELGYSLCFSLPFTSTELSLIYYEGTSFLSSVKNTSDDSAGVYFHSYAPGQDYNVIINVTVYYTK